MRIIFSSDMDELQDEKMAKVRDLIFAYERQSSIREAPSTEEINFVGRQRAKSIGNSLSYKLFRQPDLEIHGITDIEKELVKIEAHLNYYEVYEKETHVAFQEQLFSILTNIVNIDSEGIESTTEKKKQLIEETQKLSKILNTKLPFNSLSSPTSSGQKMKPIIASDKSRKEDAVVSTTSNGINRLISFKKSEESSNSSLMMDTSSNNFETPSPSPSSASVVVESEKFSPSFMPSVSRLKKFFLSYTTPAAACSPSGVSGISRSQSLKESSPCSKAKVLKKDKLRETIIISKTNGTTIENVDESIISDGKKFNESVKKSADPDDDSTSLNVSQLKTLFEEKRKQTDEENYLNYTGLLRNIDIHKKNEINKSKSMSDLKAENSDRFPFEEDIDENLNGIADNLDEEEEEDFEQISITAKNGSETQNEENGIDNTELFYSSGKVEALKKTFETPNNHENNIYPDETDFNEYIKKNNASTHYKRYSYPIIESSLAENDEKPNSCDNKQVHPQYLIKEAPVEFLEAREDTDNKVFGIIKTLEDSPSVSNIIIEPVATSTFCDSSLNNNKEDPELSTEDDQSSSSDNDDAFLDAETEESDENCVESETIGDNLDVTYTVQEVNEELPQCSIQVTEASPKFYSTLDSTDEEPAEIGQDENNQHLLGVTTLLDQNDINKDVHITEVALEEPVKVPQDGTDPPVVPISLYNGNFEESAEITEAESETVHNNTQNMLKLLEADDKMGNNLDADLDESDAISISPKSLGLSNENVQDLEKNNTDSQFSLEQSVTDDENYVENVIDEVLSRSIVLDVDEEFEKLLNSNNSN